MKILLAEKSENLISALTLVLSEIKNNDVKEISLVLHVDKVSALFKELKKERPDVLIINGGFVDHKTREIMPGLQELYPLMSILILSTDPKLENSYSEIGIENFILKGDSTEEFYKSMVVFLKKEQDAVPVDILHNINGTK